MISRRALLGTGAATAAVAAAFGGLALSHRLDDVADAVGIEPHPEPDPADTRLLTRVAAAQAELLGTVEAYARRGDLRLDRHVAIGREHLEAVGGSRAARAGAEPSRDPAVAAATLRRVYVQAARARAVDARRATSPDLARVLASMSAGLSQCSRTIGGSR